MNISDLTIENIYWLSWLADLQEPCGLIHNNSDKVIWVNNCIVLKPGTITTATYLDNNKLVSLKNLIGELPLVNFKDKHKAFVNYKYIIKSAGVLVEVLDRFYKIEIAGEIFRIFVQIEEKLI